MNRIVGFLTALILAISLSACASTEAPDIPEVVTETNKDEIFLSAVREEYPAFVSVPDQTIIDMAKNSCDAFDAGVSLEDTFRVIAQSSSNSETEQALAFTVGAGVTVYCPQHTDLVENFGITGS